MASSLDNQQQPANVELPNKTIGGYDCVFVDPPPDVFQTECPVCLLIIRDPHQVTCCGNSFCHSCIEHIKSSNKPCPTCSETDCSSFADKRLKRTLCTFKVHCSHQKDGCEWTGELGQLDAHVNEDPEPKKELDGCQFVNINCFFMCGGRFQRHYVGGHQFENCPKRPFSCEYCHAYDAKYDDVTHNHWPVCGSFPLRCPNECGVELPRQKMDSHVDIECPLASIECDFHHVGCTVELSRKDLPEHFRENLITHMSLLAASHAKQQKEIASLVSENNSYQSKQLSMEQTIEELREENEQLKTKAVMLSLKLDHISTPRMSIPLAPPVLIMSNFQQHKLKKVIWLSPPIYTHYKGYKVRLRVDASGHGNDSHISVFLHFMKGEFDESLKWPFRGAFHFQVLDQVDGSSNIKHMFLYNDQIRDSACSRVTNGEMSVTGCGESKLIAHSQLEPKYLKNDTLLFQIDKVELS